MTGSITARLADGSNQPRWRSINTNGTGESNYSTNGWFGMGWVAGAGLTEVPQAWADANTGGRNLITVSLDGY